MKFRVLAALSLTLTLSGCAAIDYTKSLFITGISIEQVGEQFIQVTNQMVAGCRADVIPDKLCDQYGTFFQNFQKTYPLAVGMWKAADKAGDTATKRKAEDVVRVLATDMTRLVIEALGTFAPVEK